MNVSAYQSKVFVEYLFEIGTCSSHFYVCVENEATIQVIDYTIQSFTLTNNLLTEYV